MQISLIWQKHDWKSQVVSLEPERWKRFNSVSAILCIATREIDSTRATHLDEEGREDVENAKHSKNDTYQNNLWASFSFYLRFSPSFQSEQNWKKFFFHLNERNFFEKKLHLSLIIPTTTTKWCQLRRKMHYYFFS